MKKVLQTVAVLILTASAMAQQNIPLPEHPRPDFERKEWINLNGKWAFTFDSRTAEAGIAANDLSGFGLTINVPFPWGSKLSGVANDGDKGYYGRSVVVPESWRDKRIFIVVGACEWDTKVWFDGALIGDHRGGYTPFEFELTDRVQFGKAQNIVVGADDTPSDHRLYGKQGYGDARGIWQTVYLEARGDNYIDYVHFSPDIDRSAVKVEVGLDRLPAKNERLRLHFANGEQQDFSYAAKGKDVKSKVQRFEIKLDNQHLWDLDDPYLYDIEVSIADGDKTVDRVSTYFGQRKIGAAPFPGATYQYVTLNNKPVYLQLTLDQSYHPDGFYTFPSDNFMRDEILLSKRLGLNGNRIHIKVEVPRKLYWADKLGLLIMADTPNFWGEPDDDAQADWEYCMRNQLKRDFNHPSVFAWVNFNETWGLFTTRDGKRAYRTETQDWVRRMYLETKKLDPTRLVEDNSPCNRDHVVSDLNSWHMYLPGYEWAAAIRKEVENTYLGSTWNYIDGNKQTGAPMFNSECGNVWGYDGSTGDVDYTWDYHIMMNAFRSNPLCAGWLYTEHHDVINEWNGYVRYDRSPKYDGMDAFVPGMSIADLHTLYYIAPQTELCSEAKAGSTVEIPLFASFMTDKDPGPVRIETSLKGWDALGNESTEQGATYPVAFKPYRNEIVTHAKTVIPEQNGLYALRFELKNAAGMTLGRNFVLFVVKDGQKPVSARNIDLVTVEPSRFDRAQWSVKQWDVLDGLKVNGAGSGYFEYTVPWNPDISLQRTESVMLVFEASAKKLFGKDNDALTVESGDFMLGKGTHDASINPNAYPMTGTQPFPSLVKVSVNGVVCGEAVLPDDPADHRGVLSWFAQPHDRKLREAGSYGYLVRVVVPRQALIEGQDIRIRLETPDGINGGLAIYGKDFGRYPLDPTLVFIGR
ncbi:MAG: glycoside hydrolase family 2 [Tannerella sp.]|nr:glycoside hydrolase family 2 [Tannerella sp.]